MNALTAIDWGILCVVGISGLLSLMRGFVREAFSLAGWVFGLLIAFFFAGRAGELLATKIADPTSREIIAFASLLILTLIASTLLSKMIQSVMEKAGLGLVDRLLGMAFGLARGVFILLALIVILRPALDLDRFQWWQQSILLPHLVLMENWFHQTMAVARDALYGLFD